MMSTGPWHVMWNDGTPDGIGPHLEYIIEVGAQHLLCIYVRREHLPDLAAGKPVDAMVETMDDENLPGRLRKGDSMLLQKWSLGTAATHGKVVHDMLSTDGSMELEGFDKKRVGGIDF